MGHAADCATCWHAEQSLFESRGSVLSSMMESGKAASVLVNTGQGSIRGSAFAVSPHLALTALHIVEQEDEKLTEIKIRPVGQVVFLDCEVIWTSRDLSLALLRLNGLPERG